MRVYPKGCYVIAFEGGMIVGEHKTKHRRNLGDALWHIAADSGASTFLLRRRYDEAITRKRDIIVRPRGNAKWWGFRRGVGYTWVDDEWKFVIANRDLDVVKMAMLLTVEP